MPKAFSRVDGGKPTPLISKSFVTSPREINCIWLCADDTMRAMLLCLLVFFFFIFAVTYLWMQDIDYWLSIPTRKTAKHKIWLQWNPKRPGESCPEISIKNDGHRGLSLVFYISWHQPKWMPRSPPGDYRHLSRNTTPHLQLDSIEIDIQLGI